MRNVLVTLTLLCALALTAQPTNQKVIQDPVEYNAYVSAVNTMDPAAKAAAMEAFVARYPQSVVIIDALEYAMAGYQQIDNQPKLMETVQHILQVSPDHMQALAVVVAVDRNKATHGDRAALKEGCAYAQRGVQKLPAWQKPEGTNDSDYDKVRKTMATVFNGAAGFCALQDKNFPAARDALTEALRTDPNDLQNVYQLAVADLEMRPMDVRGLWYCAKALNVARAANNVTGENAISPYCKAKYKSYHGSDDGWDVIISQAGSGNDPGPDFKVKPAPTPADLAVQAVQENPPEQLSFSDKEFILSMRDASPANKDAADKVWASIQDMEKHGAARLEIPAKVISATKDTIDAAIEEDHQKDSEADIHVILEKPVLHPPEKGAMVKITGVITSYTPKPILFTMEHGAVSSDKP